MSLELSRQPRINAAGPAPEEGVLFRPRAAGVLVERVQNPVTARFMGDGRRICMNGKWTDEIEQNLFGRKLTAREIYHLCGAPADTFVDLYPHWNGGITWTVKGYPIVQQCGSVARANNGDLVLGCETMEVARDEQKKGYNTHSLALQVAVARQLEADRIILAAQGSIKLSNKRGYFVYPKLGFDAELREEDFKVLPEKFAGAKTVQDIFAFGKEGEEYWLNSGTSRVMSFSLRDNSRSLQILRNYLTKKEIPVRI